MGSSGRSERLMFEPTVCAECIHVRDLNAVSPWCAAGVVSVVHGRVAANCRLKNAGSCSDFVRGTPPQSGLRAALEGVLEAVASRL